jgi:hypothetical protein
MLSLGDFQMARFFTYGSVATAPLFTWKQFTIGSPGQPQRGVPLRSITNTSS